MIDDVSFKNQMYKNIIFIYFHVLFGNCYRFIWHHALLSSSIALSGMFLWHKKAAYVVTRPARRNILFMDNGWLVLLTTIQKNLYIALSFQTATHDNQKQHHHRRLQREDREPCLPSLGKQDSGLIGSQYREKKVEHRPKGKPFAVPGCDDLVAKGPGQSGNEEILQQTGERHANCLECCCCGLHEET